MTLTPEREKKLRALHALGLTDVKLAQALGVSHATLKRYKQRLGLGSNCVRNNRGELGEQAVLSELHKRGCMAHKTGRGEPHDITVAVGQVRVEVKTAMQRPDGTWRYNLEPRRKSLFGQYRYWKDYRHDSDVTVLVGLYPDGRAEFWLYESSDLGDWMYTRLDNPYTEPHRNDWALIERLMTERAPWPIPA